jgi:hypothetical protein
MRNLFKSLAVATCAFSLLTNALRAHVLDNFDDNKKTDWEDFTFVPGLGLPTEENGQFKFNLPPAGQQIFVASTKTSETYTIEEGKTVEFRVDLVSGNGKDSFAVLAFIPKSSSASSLGGYGFAKSTTDILVTKGVGKYFYNQNPEPALKNDNVTMVLSLTGQGGNVVINAKLLDKDDNNAVLFEKTFVDTPGEEILDDGEDKPGAPYMGAGNFVLYCFEDFDDKAPQDSYEVVLDNAETYVLENIVLDDFNDNTKTDWTDFTFVPNFGIPVEANGQYKFELPPAGQQIFVASTKTSRTFDLTEGNRVEFSVDLIEGNGKDAFAVLSFIPTSSDASTLAGYGFSKSTTDILLTKGIGKYFYNQNPAEPIKNENVTLKLSLTVKNGSVIINGKVLDKDNNNAVLFDKTFIDTPGEEILDDGEDKPGAPYIGSGRFVLYCFEDFDDAAPQDVYRVIFDNALVSAPPAAANTPPTISDILPATSSSFLPASTTISFKVSDDKALTNDKISVMLNGQPVLAANLTIIGGGNSRTVAVNGLIADSNYSATFSVTDADNATTFTTIYFDTFAANDLVIEAEDYNFGGGQFIDNPKPLVEGSGPQATGYANQIGTVDVDYHDTRGDLQDVPYRPDDHVRMQHTLDVARQKFVDAGGTSSSVFDYDVGDVAAGEWLNYTRTFPAGTYEVYLRESLVNGTQIQTDLAEVTGDPAQPNPATRSLGSFRTTTTGYQYRNIPLTDALGQKVLLRLSGKKTLQLQDVSAEPGDGAIYQNYLIFVPVAGAPVQRATIANVSPANGTTVETLSPSISASIQNRDTTVDLNTVKLFVNNTQVAATLTPTTTGVDVSFPLPRPASGATETARLEFKDSDGVAISNEWSFTITYKSLDPANRASGPGKDRGMNIRFVQAPAGSQLDNSILRAEEQLAPNSPIDAEIDVTSLVQVVNFNQQEGDAGDFPGDTIVPGLDPENNGTDDFAVELTTWLDLSAGVHRFGVITDDGYKVASGSRPDDRSAAPLAFHTGGTANETFDFLVPEAGVYPFRMVWYERGGDANAEWFSVDLNTGEKTLINDPDASNAVKAYMSINAPAIELRSSTVVTGPYRPDATAIIDDNAKTITIPLAAGNHFYQIAATGALRITSTQISGQSLVLKYGPVPPQ